MDLKAILEKYFSKEALTEEAKTEIEALFEATISEVVNSKLEEEKAALEEKNTTELKEFKENLVESLSDYLEESFSEWFNENKQTMVSDVKIKMAESVMKNLRGVLVENYVEIKEEDYDVISDLETQVTELKTKVDTLGEKNINNKKQLFEYEKAIAFSSITEGMTASDKQKLLTLVEDITASDITSFTEKVNIIKEKLVESTATVDDLDKGKIEIENPDTKLTEDKTTDMISKYLPKSKIW